MTACRLLVLVLAAGLTGCGARTTLSLEAETDASPRVDGGALDGAIDGGPADAGRDAGPIAVRCARDADCSGATVCRAPPSLTPIDLAPIELLCGSADPGAPPGGDCADRAECDRGLCAVAGACVRACANDVDCDPSERCREVYVRTSPGTMQPTRGCTALVVAPDSVRVAGPEPGPVLRGFETSTDVLPGLAPDALVMWVAGDGVVPYVQAIRTRATPPVLVFDATVGGRDFPAPDWGVAATTISDVVTVLYPNGTRTPVSPEGFSFEMGSVSFSDSTRLIAQRGGEGSVFDIDAYLVGGGGWTPGDDELQRTMDDARAAFAPAGITIGEVRVHEVVGGLRRRFQVLTGMEPPLGVPADLSEMYRLSAGARRPSVHVFFVRMIEGALGVASGIPGPHVLPGTGASGVAIAVDLIPSDLIGKVMAHEIGHFMGLFHTSEADGAVNDPFDDTEECRADRDTDLDGYLLPFECTGSGADLLMFWAGEESRISPEQAALMRRAYFVR